MKRTTVDIKNRPRIPIPDEDPYSIAGSNMVSATREQLMMQTAARRGDKPPKLPPRDPSNPYPHDIPKVITAITIIIITNYRRLHTFMKIREYIIFFYGGIVENRNV